MEALGAAVATGEAHTVRVCFSDHYGTLRGRRLVAEEFVKAPSTPQAFCDGALVWDVQCEIFEETRYSNFSTGYPDLYARPDLRTLAPCGWVAGEWTVFCDVVELHGAPVLVDPRQAMHRVLDRVGHPVRARASLDLHVEGADGWQPGAPSPWAAALAQDLGRTGVDLVALQPLPDVGRVRLHVGQLEALALADALATVRTAARELGAQHGVRVSSMARTRTGQEPGELTLAIAWPGGVPAAAAARAHELSLLQAPLPLGYPRPARAPAGRSYEATVVAASDANPWLALASGIAACAVEDHPGVGPAESYRAGIDRLRACRWAREWFDELLLHDAVALAERELALRDRHVGAWDLERYGDVG
jgi:hypothetical protein